MKETFKLSRAMLSVFISVFMIAGGMLSIGTQNAYAEEIDTSATYTSESTSGYFATNKNGHEVGLTIKKGGSFFELAVCMEPSLHWPDSAGTTPASYASESKVDKSLNTGRASLDAAMLEKMRKIIYIYSETNKLDTYFSSVTGAFKDRGMYEAVWEALVKTTGQTHFSDFSDWDDTTTFGDRKGACEYLMSDDPNVKVPSGLELAFFENIEPSPTTPGATQHATQTLVALKLYGTAAKTPSIKNTTAKVNDTATNVELASGAEGTMTDEVTFENLETGKEYTVESSLLKDGSAFDTATTKVTGPATSVKVTFKKKITEAGKYQVKTVLKLDGKEVASHNDNLDVDTETVTVTVTEKPKDDKVTVKISKTDMNGKEVEGAVIVIKDKDGNEVLKWTSDKTVKSFEVAPGTYTLEETNAPDGYQKVETKIEFEVSNDGSVTVKTADVKPAGACEVKDGVLVLKDAVSAKDEKVTVKISKTDMNGKEVEGAVIVIKDKDGNEVLKWTSDKTVKSFEVAPGTYTLEETNAPDGYQKVETKIEFEVSNDGSVTVKTTEVKPAGACEVKDGVLVLKDAVSASEDTTTDTTTKKKPVISVTKTSDIKKAEVGDRVKYTITVKNSGDADASDVQVVDSLPEGLDYVSDDHDGEADGQDVSWTLDIAAGKSIKISLVAEINEDASGKILNTVKVVGEEGVFEGVSDSANVEVKGVYEDTAEDDDNDDSNTAGSSESGSNSKGSGSPNTGDDTDVAELIALMLACAAGLEIVRRRRIN